MYYPANEHISVATSDSPLGPFKQYVQLPMLESEKCIHVSQSWEQIWPLVNEAAFVVKRNKTYLQCLPTRKAISESFFMPMQAQQKFIPATCTSVQLNSKRKMEKKSWLSIQIILLRFRKKNKPNQNEEDKSDFQ